jgi:hypothetical protein
MWSKSDFLCLNCLNLFSRYRLEIIKYRTQSVENGPQKADSCSTLRKDYERLRDLKRETL